MVAPFDVLHYYIGCPFRYTYPDGYIIYATLQNWNDTYFLMGDSAFLFGKNKRELTSPKTDEEKWYEIELRESKSRFALILNHVSDMSHEQKSEYKELCERIEDKDGNVLRIADTAESFHWLLSHHFDCFDFIELGLCLDRSIVKKKIKLPD